ncbi:unnamed protein product, partial [Phaeothamnion confervicola]
MVKKRSRSAERWDGLPWKAVDVELEADDGLHEESPGEDERFLLFSLEEIDGAAYAYQKNENGAATVTAKRAKDVSDAADEGEMDAMEAEPSVERSRTRRKKHKAPELSAASAIDGDTDDVAAEFSEESRHGEAAPPADAGTSTDSMSDYDGGGAAAPDGAAVKGRALSRRARKRAKRRAAAVAQNADPDGSAGETAEAAGIVAASAPAAVGVETAAAMYNNASDGDGDGDDADAAVAVPSSPSSQSPWELSEADSAAMM